MSVTVILRYEGTSADRFDREYYCNTHMPKAKREWTPYGLLDARVFFPALQDSRKGTVCICECVFSDEAAVKAAFTAACTRELVADFANFTDLPMTPAILKTLSAEG